MFRRKAKKQVVEYSLQNAMEIIDTLDAICVVAKSAARKIAILEERYQKGTLEANGKVAIRPGHAHKGHTV